jgi:hypothetical protein
VIQIEKFAPHRAAKSGEFLDHYTRCAADVESRDRAKGQAMNAAFRILAVVFLSLGLSACFTSPVPLIGPEDAVFPFEKIVFGEVSREDDRQTWIKKGDAYSFRPDSEEREALIRLKAVGENLYVVQMEFHEDETMRRLYGVLAVDLAAMRVKSYAAIIPDDFNDVPGLSRCDDVVCIADLDAYVAYARAGMEAGRPPDTEYRIISLE